MNITTKQMKDGSYNIYLDNDLIVDGVNEHELMQAVADLIKHTK